MQLITYGPFKIVGGERVVFQSTGHTHTHTHTHTDTSAAQIYTYMTTTLTHDRTIHTQSTLLERT